MYPITITRIFFFSILTLMMFQDDVIRHNIMMSCIIYCLMTSSVSKLPQSLSNPYTYNLPATSPPCSAITCQSKISFIQIIASSFSPIKTNFGLHAFQSTASIIWNKLPVDIESAPSIASVKAHLKTHYFPHTSWLVTWSRASDSPATLRLVRAL